MGRCLLLFKNGQKLNDIGLKALKIYTASVLIKRLNWVNENMEKIIDLDNDELWREADEPLIFLACAMELKGYQDAPDLFISRLPILMDATCNGFKCNGKWFCFSRIYLRLQKMIFLGIEVIPHIKMEVSKASSLPDHFNLRYINVERCLVKRGLMTITYGATQIGIYDKIVSNFFQKDEGRKTSGIM